MIMGIGVDIIEINRIERAIKRRPNFQYRVYTKEELEYCLAKSNPWPSLAVRFAAKEATLKAIGHGISQCGLQEIEIVKGESGPPLLRLHGQALALAQEKGINVWHLSLSHGRKKATAFVLAERRLEGQDVFS